MKRNAGLIATFVAVLSLTCAAFPAEQAAGLQVVGHEFTGISAPGVTGVFWTRREDHYTLQIQFSTPPAIRRVETLIAGRTIAGELPSAPAVTGEVYPDVRVQLRGRNGAVIPHLRRLAVDPGLKSQPILRGAPDGTRRTEVVYTFRSGDGENANTMALQIDGREFVEKVPRLSGGKTD